MALAVRNWKKHQHYKDRNPPWIKLYTALLDDPAFLALPDAAKGQLCTLFLLAAKRQNVLPDKPATLKALLGVTGRFYLDALLAGGWLVRDSDGDSTADSTPAIKNASTADSGLRARSRDVELELETTSSTTREAFLSRFDSGQRAGWLALLNGWAEGMGTPGGKAYTVEQIDAGLAEYLANEPQPTFAARHVVRYVEQVAGRKANEPAAKPRRAHGDTGYLASVIAEEEAKRKAQEVTA